MGNAQERIQQAAGKQASGWLDDAMDRQENKYWRRRSFMIAMRILREIRSQKAENGMNQKMLAELMGVSPQYINKIVKGRENLTLETISKIEIVLGITLIEVSYVRSAKLTVAKPESIVLPLPRSSSRILTESSMAYKPEQFTYATGTDG